MRPVECFIQWNDMHSRIDQTLWMGVQINDAILDCMVQKCPKNIILPGVSDHVESTLKLLYSPRGYMLKTHGWTRNAVHVCVVKSEIKLTDWHFLFVKLTPSFTFINDFHYFSCVTNQTQIMSVYKRLQFYSNKESFKTLCC